MEFSRGWGNNGFFHGVAEKIFQGDSSGEILFHKLKTKRKAFLN